MAMRKADKEDSEENVDEIKQYRDARWVTPLEALWRIYGFDLSDRYPSVLSLQLHLLDIHMVSFHWLQGIQRVLDRPGADKSMLIAYFGKNRIDETTQGILYQNFPKIYTWQA